MTAITYAADMRQIGVFNMTPECKPSFFCTSQMYLKVCFVKKSDNNQFTPFIKSLYCQVNGITFAPIKKIYS